MTHHRMAPECGNAEATVRQRCRLGCLLVEGDLERGRRHEFGREAIHTRSRIGKPESLAFPRPGRVEGEQAKSGEGRDEDPREQKGEQAFEPKFE